MNISANANMDAGVDLEQMINAHGQAILRYCHLLLRDYHEAQDVVQTTFIKAFYSKAAAKYTLDNLSPLLYKIAYNQCMDILRKRKRLFGFLEREKREVKEFYQMDEGISEEVNAALGTLDPDDRALVISRIINGFEYEELSQIYGLPSPTLRKRYERAKKRLADSLREQGFGGAYE
ncbi:MAG: sigma-70 family RNA polymerase sigma factor [Defluviitaleaceae bacterium]|nr:sigma-70 family RNA polymerase sigma factor [Defluviitaleaceae bacterium]